MPTVLFQLHVTLATLGDISYTDAQVHSSSWLVHLFIIISLNSLFQSVILK